MAVCHVYLLGMSPLISCTYNVCVCVNVMGYHTVQEQACYKNWKPEILGGREAEMGLDLFSSFSVRAKTHSPA